MSNEETDPTADRISDGADDVGAAANMQRAGQSDRREDRRHGSHPDRRNHGDQKAQRSFARLKYGALALLIVGMLTLLTQGLREAPVLERHMIGEMDGYRLNTGRATPASATALSDDFVPASTAAREQVLQRLSELRATWKLADPRIAVFAMDAVGDANDFATQLRGWLEQLNLAAGTAASAPDTAGIPGATLPAPQMAGVLIRCREKDGAIARDLALALAPTIGGEVNIVFDERVSASQVYVALVGAPSFGADGVAYFRAI